MSPSDNSEKRIFVTGGSGFIAYHIIHRLLTEGYKVRTTARGAKVEKLRRALAASYDWDPSHFEVVDVPDIASGDFSVFLKDVVCIIHNAYPMVGRPGFDLTVHSVVEGALHILREGVKAGVLKFITTSSGSTFDVEGDRYGVHDFVALTADEARAAGSISANRYSKALGDHRILEFQDEHPEIDITILAPNWVYGPFPPGFENIIPEGDILSISSNLCVYSLLCKDAAYCRPTFPGYVDVRDVARAHVLALKSRPTSEVGHKRFILVSPYDSSWADAAAHLTKERPELYDRLLEVTDVPKPPFGYSVRGVRSGGLEEAVRFKASEYRKWEDTILDTVDSVLALEAWWKAKGFSISVPTVPAIIDY